MTQKLLWLDCDPGSDDAFAIILACFTPQLKVLGISTVFGNNTIEITTKNALKILEISGATDIKVFKGSSQPLMRKSKIEKAAQVHGDQGLGKYVNLPEPQIIHEQGNCIQNMYQIIKDAEQKVNLCACGSLTNLAKLFLTFPDVLENIEQLIIMGGAIGEGNVTPHSEFNIHCDPESAQIVFHQDVKIILIPLELTHQIVSSQEVQDKLNQMNTKFSSTFLNILLNYAEVYKLRGMDCPPLHDPNIIAYLIDSTIYQGEEHYIEVEHQSKNCDGRINLTQNQQNQKRKVYVVTKGQSDKFWKLMLYSLQEVNRKFI